MEHEERPPERVLSLLEAIKNGQEILRGTGMKMRTFTGRRFTDDDGQLLSC